jgi:hypothetical protein
MRVRGERECRDCGREWSYYETGSVECPDCGSLRSVGVEDERTLHTATPAELDLSPVRNAVDEIPLQEVCERAAEACREFTNGYGFVDAGELRSLDDRYLAAVELKFVAGDLAGRLRVDDEEEIYLLSLLRGADLDGRPSPDEVPGSLRGARNLAYAEAIDAYRSDLRAYLEADPEPSVAAVLGPLRSHLKRVDALDGELSPADTERLVAAVRGVAGYVRDGDEAALLSAGDRLDRLG